MKPGGRIERPSFCVGDSSLPAEVGPESLSEIVKNPVFDSFETVFLVPLLSEKGGLLVLNFTSLADISALKHCSYLSCGYHLGRRAQIAGVKH